MRQGDGLRACRSEINKNQPLPLLNSALGRSLSLPLLPLARTTRITSAFLHFLPNDDISWLDQYHFTK